MLPSLVSVLLIGTLAQSPTAPRPTETFQKAKLSVQDGDDTKNVDAILRYDPLALVILDKKTQRPLKAFAYDKVESAEYSYAKSPRWKTAIFVSPLFLFTSGKKHWFMVKGDEDYAVIQLDKSNYRMVLAAFEVRTGKKVEVVADNK